MHDNITKKEQQPKAALDAQMYAQVDYNLRMCENIEAAPLCMHAVSRSQRRVTAGHIDLIRLPNWSPPAQQEWYCF